MDVKMKMPDLSTTGAEVRIMQWLVPLGGQVTRGAPLLEVETDKATMEVESIVSGVLKTIVTPPETNVAVGDVIAVIEVAQSAAARPVAAPAPGADTAGGGGATATQPTAAPAKAPTGAAASSAPTKPPAGAAAPARGMFARNRAKPADAAGSGATPPADEEQA